MNKLVRILETIFWCIVGFVQIISREIYWILNDFLVGTMIQLDNDSVGSLQRKWEDEERAGNGKEEEYDGEKKMSHRRILSE